MRTAARSPDRAVGRPARRPLPDHLPREEIVHEPACSCPACDGPLRRLGEDVSEMLEHVPTSFRVVRHVRPKLPCARCERIVQSEAPSRPIARGLAGPGLLAPVLVAKYAVRVSAPKTIFGRSGASCRLTAMPAPTGSTATRSSRLLAGRTVVAPRARNQHGPGAPLRGVALGRKNWLFAGSDAGGQ